MYDDIIKKMFQEALNNSYRETGAQIRDMSRKINFSYQRLEFSPSIDTNITDADMLRIHIDIALDNGDKDLFMKLTEQLMQIENHKYVGATV